MGFLDSILNRFRKPKPIPELPKVTAFPPKPVNPIGWRFLEDSGTRKILRNPWNSQRDNKFCPGSSCNVTSMQVALSLDTKVTDDELFLLCNSSTMRNNFFKKYPGEAWVKPHFDKGKANEVFLVLQEAARCILESDKYCKMIGNLSRELIISEIDKGYPVIVCGAFIRGKSTLEHFVTIVGYDLEKKVWIVNDSWGNWNTGYKDRNGERVPYSMDKMRIGSVLSRLAILVHADRRVPV